MKRRPTLLCAVLLLCALFACGTQQTQAPPAAAPDVQASPAFFADGVYYSALKAFTDTEVTLRAADGTWRTFPLDGQYLLHGKQGDELCGELSKDSLYRYCLKDGTVTDLTWLVSAQGWTSVVSNRFAVIGLEEAPGGQTMSVVSETGTSYEALFVPGGDAVYDAEGTCVLALGDVVRTAFPKGSDGSGRILPTVYVTEHAATDFSDLKEDPDLWQTLSEDQKAVRTKVVDYMTKMATLEWSPSQDIFYNDYGGDAGAQEAEKDGFTGTRYYGGYLTKYEFKAGTVYHGLPYTHQFGGYEKMAQFVDDKGILHVEDIPDDFGLRKPDQSPSEQNGWMGWDCYVGTDCSGSVYTAWSQVSNVVFDSTGNELPTKTNGIRAVGDVKCENMKIEEALAANDRETLYESYAKALPGDAMLYSGHTLLVASSAKVYRNADGTINPYASYLLITDITRTLRNDVSFDGYVNTNTQWRIRRKVSFLSLATQNGGCVMLTNDALLTGQAVKDEIQMDVQDVTDGTVTAVNGQRILYLRTEVTDESGKTVWKNTHFVVGDPAKSARYHRMVQSSCDLRSLAADWGTSGVNYEAGKTYTCRITAHLSTGGEAVGEVTFRGEDALRTDQVPLLVEATAPVTQGVTDGEYYCMTLSAKEDSLQIFDGAAWQTVPVAEDCRWTHAESTKSKGGGLYCVEVKDGKITVLDQLIGANGYTSCVNYVISAIAPEGGDYRLTITSGDGSKSYDVTLPADAPMMTKTAAFAPSELSVGDSIRTAFRREDARLPLLVKN